MSTRKTKKYKADYRQRLEFIRSWLPKGFKSDDGFDLRKKLTPSKKAEITRYYNILQELTSRQVYVYAPRSEKNKKAAREYAGLNKFKKIDRAFIAAPTRLDEKGNSRPQKPTIKIHDGKLKTEFKGYKREKIIFSDYGITIDDLILNPKETIKNLIKELGFTHYSVINGVHEIGRGAPDIHPAFKIAEVFEGIIFKYLLPEYDETDNENDDIIDRLASFLNGLIGYNFDNKLDVVDYTKSIRTNSRERKNVTKKVKAIKKKIDLRLKNIKKIENSELDFFKKIKKQHALEQQIAKFEKEITQLIINRSRI